MMTHQRLRQAPRRARGTGVVVESHYAKPTADDTADWAAIMAQVSYLITSRTDERYGLFSIDMGGRPLTRVEDATDALYAHRGRDVLYHHVVVSPAHPAHPLTASDVHSIVDRSMGALSRLLDSVPVGYYSVHENTDHRHAHALLAGRVQSGRELRLKPIHFAAMRQAGAQRLEEIAAERDRLNERMWRLTRSS